VSVEERDDSVTILENGTAKDVTKLDRIDFPILNSSHTYTDVHISVYFFPEKLGSAFNGKYFILFCICQI
jgi:hypothetical protein